MSQEAFRNILAVITLTAVAWLWWGDLSGEDRFTDSRISQRPSGSFTSISNAEHGEASHSIVGIYVPANGAWADRIPVILFTVRGESFLVMPGTGITQMSQRRRDRDGLPPGAHIILDEKPPEKAEKDDSDE